MNLFYKLKIPIPNSKDRIKEWETKVNKTKNDKEFKICINNLVSESIQLDKQIEIKLNEESNENIVKEKEPIIKILEKKININKKTVKKT